MMTTAITYAFRDCKVTYDGQKFEVYCSDGNDYVRVEPGLTDDESWERAKAINHDGPEYWCERVNE